MSEQFDFMKHMETLRLAQGNLKEKGDMERKVILEGWMSEFIFNAVDEFLAWLPEDQNEEMRLIATESEEERKHLPMNYIRKFHPLGLFPQD